MTKSNWIKRTEPVTLQFSMCDCVEKEQTPEHLENRQLALDLEAVRQKLTKLWMSTSELNADKSFDSTIVIRKKHTGSAEDSRQSAVKE